MTRLARRTAFWVSAVLWAGVIFGFSTLPGSQVPGFLPSGVGHLGEYFVLGVLLYSALRVDLSRPRALLVAVALASLYGVSDEYHQRFVAMRTPDVYDWILDTIGAALGAMAASRAEEYGARLRGKRS